MGTKVLEINLISAQGLKPPSGNSRRFQTYAVAWIDPSDKVRTRIDRLGGENPSWNDKFLFKVTPEFLASETSGISLEIYAVGRIRNPLIGTVRLIISNLSLSSTEDPGKTPSLTALQIRRPSGRFQGVLNVAASLKDGCHFAALKGKRTAIGYRELMGESIRRRLPPRDLKKSNSISAALDSCADSGDQSDGAESTTSSSSSTASTALMDWNGLRDLAGSEMNHLRSSSDGGGLLCGLLMQRRFSLCMSDIFYFGKEN